VDPEQIDLNAMVRLAPEVLMRPRWLRDFAKTRKLPDLSTRTASTRTASPTSAGVCISA